MSSETPKIALPPVARRMTLERRWLALRRKAREIRSIGDAIGSTDHPYMAQIVPMRRCNLSCTYCNEYDDVSDPVALD